MALLKKYLLYSKSDLGIELAVPGLTWLLLEIISVIGQLTTGDGLPMAVSPIVALVVAVFMEYGTSIARVTVSYSLGVYMGRTRKRMLSLVLIECLVHTLLCLGMVAALSALSDFVIAPAIGFPVENALLTSMPLWIWPALLLGCIAFALPTGVTVSAFGQKGFWVVWGIFMLAFVVPGNTPGLSFAAMPRPLLIAGLAIAALVLLGWIAWSIWYSLRRPVT